MSRRTLNLTEPLYQYLLANSLRESEALRRLREETAQHPRAGMQIAPEQGQLMAWLVRLIGAVKTLEVGVFTGYSALAVAEAIGPEGRVVALDVSEEFTRIARRHWAEAGVEGRIELRLAPALESLAALEAEGQANSFDFAFIDADKANYPAYLEAAYRLLRVGGVIGLDNTLWGGAVADEREQDADTVALRRLNAALHQDARFDLSLLPIGDGLTLLRKRG